MSYFLVCKGAVLCSLSEAEAFSEASLLSSACLQAGYDVLFEDEEENLHPLRLDLSKQVGQISQASETLH